MAIKKGNNNEIREHAEQYKMFLKNLELSGVAENIGIYAAITTKDIIEALSVHLANNDKLSIVLSGVAKMDLYDDICTSIEEYMSQTFAQQYIFNYRKGKDNSLPLLDFVTDSVLIPTINATIQSYVLKKIYSNAFYENQELDTKTVIDAVNDSIGTFGDILVDCIVQLGSAIAENYDRLNDILNKGVDKIFAIEDKSK